MNEDNLSPLHPFQPGQKTTSTNEPRLSLARTSHRFVPISLQQSLRLYKLNHMVMSPSSTSHISQHAPHIPSGLTASPHARSISVLEAGQRSLRSCTLSASSGSGRGWYPSLRSACGPARGCCSLPFMAFCKPLCRFSAWLPSGEGAGRVSWR